MVGVGGAVVAERWYGLPSERGILLTCGGVFLLAAMGRPWWLYAAIRRLGWFAAITNDIAMRLLLAVIGAGLIAGALLLGRHERRGLAPTRVSSGLNTALATSAV